MAKGRTPDPGRERRQTGNRPAAGKAKPPAVRSPKLPALPEPPADLPEIARAVWIVTVEEMAGNRHLRPPDLLLVRSLCEAAYTLEEASKHVHEYGVLVSTVVRDSDGRPLTGEDGKPIMGPPIVNPLLKVQKDATATIVRVSDVLGVNPLARIRAGLMEVAGASLLGGLRDSLAAKIAKG